MIANPEKKELSNASRPVIPSESCAEDRDREVNRIGGDGIWGIETLLEINEGSNFNSNMKHFIL